MRRPRKRQPADRLRHTALIFVPLISTDRAGDVPVPVSAQEGTIILQSPALTGALAREIGTYHGVDSARSRIIGEAGDPEIVLTVTASPSADLHALHHRIETKAITHGRHALGKADPAIRLDLGVSRRTALPGGLRDRLEASRPCRWTAAVVPRGHLGDGLPGQRCVLVMGFPSQVP